MTKIVVGLGNPGSEYELSRHNAGFMVVDVMARSGWMKNKSGISLYSWLSEEVELLKPQTFMNKSGEAVAYAMKKHRVKPENLYVVHDDLDIRLGEYKLHFGKGPKVHNGVNSVIDVLGTDQFWHVRMGVENRSLENKIPGKVYLLQDFSVEEAHLFNEVVTKAAKEILNVV